MKKIFFFIIIFFLFVILISTRQNKKQLSLPKSFEGTDISVTELGRVDFLKKNYRFCNKKINDEIPV